MNREFLKEDARSVKCPKCNAKSNRQCIRLGGNNKGTPLPKPHNERIDHFLTIEAKTHGLISNIPLEQIRHDMLVRHQKSGIFGRIMHKSNNKNIWIDWDNGGQECLLHKEANHILRWQDLLIT